jgi:hypothetical protein
MLMIMVKLARQEMREAPTQAAISLWWARFSVPTSYNV